jgi:hypothetical protein
MKLPSRLALALGALLAGVITLTQELNLSHPIHQAIVLAGAFIAAVLINPTTSTTASTPDQYPPAGANQTASPPPIV